METRVTRARELIDNVWINITVEPLVFLFCTVLAVQLVNTEELYLHKGCQVNLNYSQEICTNLTQHKDVQKQTQQLVSAVQAHNGILQNIPVVVFTLFAAPLSDSYGRKPLMVAALFGLIILNIVFIINVIWFNELKVEYLLLECLQDLTGGRTIFVLAATSYLVDITSVETRTVRICFLFVAMELGWSAGPPLGTKLRNSFGYLVLYSTNLCLAVATILYCIFFLKESIHLVSEERRVDMLQEKENADIKCDRGVFQKIIKTVLSNFRALLKKRPQRHNLWIFMIMSLIVTFVENVDSYMFYTLQYNIDTETFGWVSFAYGISALLSQFILVPFLSLKLGLRDSTIISMSLASNAISFLLEALSTQIWVLFLSKAVLQSLWSNLYSGTNSAISKLVKPTEIAKCLGLLELGKSLVVLCGKPFLSYMYKGYLSTLPAICLYIALLCFIINLILAIHNNISMKKQEDEINVHKEEK